MTHEKYTSGLRFNRVRLQRAVLRAMIRRLVRWQPMTDPQPGYTVIIGAQAALAKLVDVNLDFVSRQQREGLSKIIVVFDKPRGAMDEPAEDQLRGKFPDLPLEFIYYTDRQMNVLERVKWGWCYSWLSWSLGISATQTQYALLHDLDAMLIAPDLLERQHRAIAQRRDQYVGVKYYNGNGIVPADGLVTTFELIFDAAFVREHFKPIDLFNHVRRYNGRRVEFDTFLHAQASRGAASITEIDAEEMVHPSQLICQVTDLRREGDYRAPAVNNLPLLPYFFFLAGDEAALETHRDAFDQADGPRVAFLGHTMTTDRLTEQHVKWLEVQVDRLEKATAGRTRPEVNAYFQSIHRFVARQRGTATVAAGGVASGSGGGQAA